MSPNQSRLVKLLEKHSKKDPSKFPRGATVNYYQRFRNIEAYLNTEVHPHTATGAMASQMGAVKVLSEAQASPEEIAAAIIKNSAWLTDHGPEHVSTVIDRASLLVADSDAELSPYEIYVLLVAIHFHDVGNIFGREGHETRITEIMAQMENAIIGDDSAERRLIRDIAAAHGGKNNGDPDTIGRLPYPRGNNQQSVRTHLLAGILRFADELADDFTRAARFPLLQGQIGAASEVFHMYADRLTNVGVNEGVISLEFELDRSQVSRTYGKGSQQVYLLDEIYDRTLKMHQEHIYCMRFMRTEIRVNRIDVNIGIFTDRFMKEIFHFNYVLEERGYPSTSDFYTVARPQPVVPSSGERLTGASLNDYIASIPTS